jgi:hypothetical protein
MIYDVHRGTLTLPWREQDVAISIATSGKTFPVNRLGGNERTLFATRVANGQSICKNMPHVVAHEKKRRLGKTEVAL